MNLAADDVNVKLSFEDTGPGVPTAIRHRIFDAFFTTKRAGQSDGLGLTVSQSIIADHVSLPAVTESKNIITACPQMETLLDKVQLIADSPTAVLLTGESGTGKDLLARALHFQSRRAKAPFIQVNCAAIPDNLLESELFGHVKGCFTDARQNKPGLFQAAHEGTLFLDDVDGMPSGLQAKLLTAIEGKRVRREEPPPRLRWTFAL